MWVIYVLVGLLLLILLVLSVPIDFGLNIDIHGRPRFSFRITWLFGLISKELGKEKKKGPEILPESIPQEKQSKKKGRRGGIRPDNRSILSIFRTKGLLKQFIRLLTGIVRCLDFREVKVDLNIGLTNPADTGQLFAMAMPVSLFLQAYTKEINIQPSFTGPGIYGTAYGAARIQPIQLTVPVAMFVFSRPILKTAKILVTAKWTRRK